MIKKGQIKIKYIFINKIIADDLIKSLNRTKFINFIKMLNLKSKFIMNNTVGKRLDVDI